MRWLLIALFVSLAALLIAATGSAIHILVQRARLRSKPVVPPNPALGPVEEIEQKTEI
jgi:hypothetical protein